MGSKSKGKRQQMNFSDAVRYLSDLQDQKQLQYTKDFTQTLSTMKLRLEALEDILLEKLNETEDSLKERVFTRIEKNQGFVPVDTDIQMGSILRIQVKEEVVGQESPTNPMQDAFMVVGRNQVNPAVDTLVIGAKLGETRDVVLDDPTNAEIKRKLTVTILKVFRGEESINETKTNENQQIEQAAAQS